MRSIQRVFEEPLSWQHYLVACLLLLPLLAFQDPVDRLISISSLVIVAAVNWTFDHRQALAAALARR